MENKISKSFCEGYEAQYKPDMIVIAEFMGIEFRRDHTTRKYWHYCELRLTSEKLHFDTSWDWLMPVVEKIERMYSDIASERSTTFQEDDAYSKVFCHPITAGIENVYKAVVEFIRWYNNTQKP